MENVESIKEAFIKKKSDSEETLSAKQIKKSKLKVIKNKLKEIEEGIAGANLNEGERQQFLREFNKCTSLKNIIFSSDDSD